VIAALALTMLAANAAFAIDVTLTPVSDRSAQDKDLNGTFETLFPEADTFLSASVESPPDLPPFGHMGEHRTAMEFDISGISSGTMVTKASLFLPRNAAGNSPIGSPLVTDIHGYVGNGG